MSVPVASLLPILELGLRLGTEAIEQREKRKLETMTHEEIVAAARKLSEEIRPWDEPIDDD